MLKNDVKGAGYNSTEAPDRVECNENRNAKCCRHWSFHIEMSDMTCQHIDKKIKPMRLVNNHLVCRRCLSTTLCQRFMSTVDRGISPDSKLNNKHNFSIYQYLLTSKHYSRWKRSYTSHPCCTLIGLAAYIRT